MSDYPVVSTWFGVDFGDGMIGAFQECTGFGSKSEVVEYKASGDGKEILRKVPGRMTYNDITLKRGITDSLEMWDWRRIVEGGDMDKARRNGSIIMYDSAGNDVARWDFHQAWPSELSGPTANAESNEIAVEELTIVVEFYERVK